MRKVVLTILVLAVLLGGCGGDSSTDGSETSATKFKPFSITTRTSPFRYEKEVHVKPSGLSGSELTPVFPKSPPPEYLAVADLIEGIGHSAVKGAKVTVQYVGYDYETHKKFASSWEQGKPFTFTLGSGEVIPAWEEGIEGMEVGDRREMVVPPELAEGPYPPGIPKGKAVIFVIETLPESSASGKSSSSTEKKGGSKKVKPKEGEVVETNQPKVSVPKGPPPKKLVTEDLREGEGPAAKSGDELTVQYVGVLYKNGKQFDSSYVRGEPFTFTLGSNSVIPGWEKGLVGMKQGGRRELILPPELAYGPEGSGAIPPNETLVFVVDLEAIK